MTPFPGDHDNLTQAEKDFNYSLSSVRQVNTSSNTIPFSNLIKFYFKYLRLH